MSSLGYARNSRISCSQIDGVNHAVTSAAPATNIGALWGSTWRNIKARPDARYAWKSSLISTICVCTWPHCTACPSKRSIGWQTRGRPRWNAWLRPATVMRRELERQASWSAWWTAACRALSLVMAQPEICCVSPFRLMYRGTARIIAGLGLGGPRGKGSPSVSKGQNHLYNYCNCWKAVQEQ